MGASQKLMTELRINFPDNSAGDRMGISAVIFI